MLILKLEIESLDLEEERSGWKGKGRYEPDKPTLQSLHWLNFVDNLLFLRSYS